MPSTWPTVCGGIYSLCGDGKHQSPIDIDTSLVVSSEALASHPLQLHYKEVYHTLVVNLGTTIHVDIGSNNTVGGGPLPSETLLLSQLHFHAPGEHRINGAQSSAEVHLVHKSALTNHTAVIVVRVQTGTANPWFDSIFQVRDLPVGGNASIDINPLQLFPESILADPHKLTHSNYYYYNGSLTTPPCSEGISWIVLIDPIFASVDQINSLERWEGINNRPIQPYNGTIYRPHFVVNSPNAEVEDIRHMGMVIGVSFLLGLVAFFAILALAILALHLRDIHDKRDFYGAQQFELQPTNY
jgi:carbonic anhydrase